MSVKLTPAQRSQVNLKIDLVSVLNQHGIAYRQDGYRTKITCPFHPGDNDPSLVIYSSNKPMTWFCFGCQRGTDALEFFRLLTKRPAEEIARQFIQTNDVLTAEDQVKMIIGEERESGLTMTTAKEILSIELAMKVRTILQRNPGKFEDAQSILMAVDDYFSEFEGDLYELRSFVKNAERRIKGIKCST